MELFHTDTDYCTLTFGVFQLDQIAHVGVSPSRGLKLFGCEIIFEVFQPVWKTYLNVTDRHTDGHTTYCRITALCVASRGKNIGQQFRLDYNNMAFEQNKGRENTYLYTTFIIKLCLFWRQTVTDTSDHFLLVNVKIRECMEPCEHEV